MTNIRKSAGSGSSGSEGNKPISWWRTDLGEEEALKVAQAVRDEHISQGPVVHEFEQGLCQYLGVPYVVATTSGSTALQMALLAAGVGPGDEVIVPNRTWIATAHAAVLLGAKVRLVDVEAGRPVIDAAQIEAAITPQTKAILPVHMNGRSADMREIRRIASRHGVLVIEDAAQALGSRNADGFLGTQSDMGCFSLSVAKIITTGQGGFVATRDQEIHQRLTAIRMHGVDSVIDAQWNRPGFNFRFTDILATIGIVQLRQLDERIEKVKSIYSRYVAEMPNLPFLELIQCDIDAGEVPVYIEVLTPDRDRLVSHLAANGIQSRPFYPELDRAKYLANPGEFPNSRRYGREGLYLPCGPGQSISVIDRTLEILAQFPH